MKDRTSTICIIVLAFTSYVLSYPLPDIPCDNNMGKTVGLSLNELHFTHICSNTTYTLTWRLLKGDYSIHVKLCDETTCVNPTNIVGHTLMLNGNIRSGEDTPIPMGTSYVTSATPDFTYNFTMQDTLPQTYFEFLLLEYNADVTYYSVEVTTTDPYYDYFEPNDNFDSALYAVDTSDTANYTLYLTIYDKDYYSLNTGGQQGNLRLYYDFPYENASIFYTSSYTEEVEGNQIPLSPIDKYSVFRTESGYAYMFLAIGPELLNDSYYDPTYKFRYQFIECLDSNEQKTIYSNINFTDSVCYNFLDDIVFTPFDGTTLYIHVQSNANVTVSCYPPGADFPLEGFVIENPVPNTNYRFDVITNDLLDDPYGTSYSILLSNQACANEDYYWSQDTEYRYPLELLSKQPLTVTATTCFLDSDWFTISGDGDRNVTITVTTVEQKVPGILSVNLNGTTSNVINKFSTNFMLWEGQQIPLQVSFDQNSSVVYNISIISQRLIKLCPIETPIRCPSDGSCVANIRSCIANVTKCPSTAPFRCFNGYCAQTVKECTGEVSCPVDKCWNGLCVEDREDCPLVPACPVDYPRRCYDGCKAANDTCQPDPFCPNNLCEDGSCTLPPSKRAFYRTCPKYQGCPLETVQCPNGKCVTNYSECLCEGNLWRCADNSCKASPLECTKPFFQIEILEFEQAFLPTETLEVTVPSTGDIENVCFVTVPKGAIPGITTEIVFSTKSVSESTMRQTSMIRQSSNSSDDLSDILSPVLNFQVLDKYGSATTNFLKEVSISCVVSLPANYSLSSLCLAFINTTTNKWECADLSLTLWNVSVDASNNLLYLNGTTNHFTSFGVLLGDDPVSDDQYSDSLAVDSHSSENVSTTVIIAVVVCAGVVIIAGMVGVCFYFRRKQARENKDLRKTVELPAYSEGA